MRKIIFFALTVSSVSFSFQKLEFQTFKFTYGGSVEPPLIDHFENIPLCIDAYKSFCLITSLNRFNLVQTNHNYIHFGIFDVEEEVRPISSPNGKDAISDFLECKFDYNFKTFWKIDNLKQYESIASGRRNGPILFGIVNNDFNKLFTKIINIYNDPNSITFYNQDTCQQYPLYNDFKKFPVRTHNINMNQEEKLQTIRLRKKYSIPHKNIDVVHQKDKVILRKIDSYGNTIQEINLHTILLDYYKKSRVYTNLARKIAVDKIESPTSSTANTIYAAAQMGYNPLFLENYKPLKNSEILTLWDVSTKPSKYKQNKQNFSHYIYRMPSILIGLARDKETKKLFHWVIDLDRDIDVLFTLDKSLGDQINAVNKNDSLPEENIDSSNLTCWEEVLTLPDTYLIDPFISRVVQFKGSRPYYIKYTQPIRSINPVLNQAKIDLCTSLDKVCPTSPLNFNDINELKIPCTEPVESRESYICWKYFWDKKIADTN